MSPFFPELQHISTMLHSATCKWCWPHLCIWYVSQVPCAAVLLFSWHEPWYLVVLLTSRGTGEKITLAELDLPWTRVSRAIPKVMGGGLLPAAWEVRQRLCSYCALTCLEVAQSKPVGGETVWASLLFWTKSSSSKTTKYLSKPKVNFPPSSWFNFNPELIQSTPRSHLLVTVWGNCDHALGLGERLIYFSGAA